MLTRTLSDSHPILVVNPGQNSTRVYHITNIACTNGIQDLRTPLTQLPAQSDSDAMLFHILRSHGRRLKVEPQIIEPLCERKRLLLILICKCEYDGPVILNVDSCRHERFVHSAVEPLIISYGFTRGLHLRRKVRIHS